MVNPASVSAVKVVSSGAKMLKSLGLQSGSRSGGWCSWRIAR